jgi:hypothetical protein
MLASTRSAVRCSSTRCRPLRPLPTPADAASRFDLGPFVAGIQNTRLTTHGAAFNYSKVLSARIVNELRLGYARTVPATFQSDFGTRAAESLGIQGINVTEFTTGLPNINVPDMTGISGGPAFLPVNPKQFHWQMENALVWLKGRHSLKFGYRLVDRYASPFTNTDTRGTINFGRNYTNNPVTNTGGSGLASPLRPERLQSQFPLHHQRRRPLRDLQGRGGRRGQGRELRPGGPPHDLRR